MGTGVASHSNVPIATLNIRTTNAATGIFLIREALNRTNNSKATAATVLDMLAQPRPLY